MTRFFIPVAVTALCSLAVLTPVASAVCPTHNYCVDVTGTAHTGSPTFCPTTFTTIALAMVQHSADCFGAGAFTGNNTFWMYNGSYLGFDFNVNYVGGPTAAFRLVLAVAPGQTSVVLAPVGNVSCVNMETTLHITLTGNSATEQITCNYTGTNAMYPVWNDGGDLIYKWSTINCTACSYGFISGSFTGDLDMENLTFNGSGTGFTGNTIATQRNSGVCTLLNITINNSAGWGITGGDANCTVNGAFFNQVCGNAGISNTGAGTWTVRNNFIYNGSCAISGSGPYSINVGNTATASALVYNNIVIGSKSAINADNSGTFDAYFNTFYGLDLACFNMGTAWPTTGHLIRNNICALNAAGQYFYDGNAVIASGKVTADYNDAYFLAARTTGFFLSPNFVYATYKSASGQDAHGLNADPLFAAGGGSTAASYIPKGSVVGGKGIAVGGITTDYAGATRANPPAIGAYEVSAFNGPSGIILGGVLNRPEVRAIIARDPKLQQAIRDVMALQLHARQR